MGSFVPAAATPRLRAWWERTDARGSLLHAGRDALYVDLAGRCVGVLTRDAVPVPCGVRTTLTDLLGRSAAGSSALSPAAGTVRAGDVVELHGGQLAVAGLTVRITRTLPVRPVRFRQPGQALARLDRRMLPHRDALVGELGAGPLEALTDGDPGAVPALLGRGSGLTPLGDDVLCGWLATADLDNTGAATVADEVDRLAATRTTALSAALLDCARHGEVLPQFERLVSALDRPDGDPAVAQECDAAVTDLVRVGHTSGAGLALGCLLGLRHRVAHPTGDPDDPRRTRRTTRHEGQEGVAA